jgi:hypothetical protein
LQGRCATDAGHLKIWTKACASCSLSLQSARRSVASFTLRSTPFSAAHPAACGSRYMISVAESLSCGETLDISLSRRFATPQVDQCVTQMSLRLPVPSGIPAWTRVLARSVLRPIKLSIRGDLWSPEGPQQLRPRRLRSAPRRWTAAELHQIFPAPAAAHVWRDVQHLVIYPAIDSAFFQASSCFHTTVVLQEVGLILHCHALWTASA